MFRKILQTVKRFLASERLSLFAFSIASLVAVYIFGAATVRYNLFPYPQIRSTISEFMVALEYSQERLLWSHFRYSQEEPTVVYSAESMMPGMTLVSSFTDGDSHSVKIVDENGDSIQSWDLDWEELWPDSTHLPGPILAREQKHLHGIELADNGDIVFNFTELAMLRVNACGDVVWRLAERAHHSVDMDSKGNFWVPGVITHTEVSPKYPAYEPNFEEFTALYVSSDGQVLKNISLNDLLIANGKQGLLNLASLDEFTPIVSGDTIHLNDLEVFPDTMPEGIFKHGDVLVTLRNINTIFVFDPETLKIRYINTGVVQRPHDADFIDGDTISIYDNNNFQTEWFDNISGVRGAGDQASKIVTLSAKTGSIIETFDVGEAGPFFTDLMGNHQRLDNGNLLVAESRAGRLFEVTSDGQLVWEYFNIIGPDLLGAITYAERLSTKFDAAFFENAKSVCEN